MLYFNCNNWGNIPDRNHHIHRFRPAAAPRETQNQEEIIMKKRFVSSVLVVAMLLTVLTGMTFATDGSWICHPDFTVSERPICPPVDCWHPVPPISGVRPCLPPCDGSHFWPPFHCNILSVTATAGVGGYITPSGTTFVKAGTVMTYYIIPASGYEIAAVYVNGVNWGNASTITFPVTGDTTISAIFSKGGSFIDGDYSKTPSKGAFYDTALELAAYSQPFYADVAPEAWYYKNITWLWNRGLVDTQTNFYPEAIATRDCIVDWIWRMEGRPVTRNFAFSDTTEMSAIWAGANHVVYGYDDNTFRPNESLNREQLTAVLYRYCLYNDIELVARGDLSVFSDAGEVSEWAAEAMSWAVGVGILEGRADGTLDPQGTATRAELAAMLNRMSLYFGL